MNKTALWCDEFIKIMIIDKVLYCFLANFSLSRFLYRLCSFIESTNPIKCQKSYAVKFTCEPHKGSYQLLIIATAANHLFLRTTVPPGGSSSPWKIINNPFYKLKFWVSVLSLNRVGFTNLYLSFDDIFYQSQQNAQQNAASEFNKK